MIKGNINISKNDAYFEVLCELVGLETPVEKSGYFELMHQLYCTEFHWSVRNDDNRAADGLALREEYGFVEADIPCSLLEMLIALAIRCDEEIMYNPTDGDRSKDWFWMMLTNLGLNKCRDRSFREGRSKSNVGGGWDNADVGQICDKFMNREYAFSGHDGGLFPLKNPHKDQREIEIWYQLSTYLLENYEIG